jgi:hypothetical protein
MMNAPTSQKESLSQKILIYLEKHPRAGDTLEGIATWWLEQQRIEEVVEDVAGALEFLIKKGTVRTIKSQSGVTIYKVKSREKVEKDE